MAERKHRIGIITHYQKMVKRMTGVQESINRNTAQWDADNLVESYGYDGTKDLIDRYFAVATPPYSWKWFANNADKVYDGWQAELRDKQERALMRERFAQWLNK